MEKLRAGANCEQEFCGKASAIGLILGAQVKRFDADGSSLRCAA